MAQDLHNPKIILNKDSDLVVGGVPSNMKLPSQVDAVNYTGCFDGLQVNNHFVGSWNSDVGHETMLKLSFFIRGTVIVLNSVFYETTKCIAYKR